MGRATFFLRAFRTSRLFHFVTSPVVKPKPCCTGIRLDSDDFSSDIFCLRRLFFGHLRLFADFYRKRTLRPGATFCPPTNPCASYIIDRLMMCLCASVSAGHSLGACSEEYRYCQCDERHGFKEVSMRTYTLLCPRGTAMLFVAQHPHTSSTGTRLSRLSSIRTHIGDGHRPSRRLPIQPEVLSLRTFSATRRGKLMALTAIFLMFSPIRRGMLMPLTGIFS